MLWNVNHCMGCISVKPSQTLLPIPGHICMQSKQSKIKVCIQSHIQKLVLLVIMQLYIPAASVVVFTGNYTLIHQFDKVHKLQQCCLQKLMVQAVQLATAATVTPSYPLSFPLSLSLLVTRKSDRVLAGPSTYPIPAAVLALVTITSGTRLGR